MTGFCIKHPVTDHVRLCLFGAMVGRGAWRSRAARGAAAAVLCAAAYWLRAGPAWQHDEQHTELAATGTVVAHYLADFGHEARLEPEL